MPYATEFFYSFYKHYLQCLIYMCIQASTCIISGVFIMYCCCDLSHICGVFYPDDIPLLYQTCDLYQTLPVRTIFDKAPRFNASVTYF